jgi:hypothetical protein
LFLSSEADAAVLYPDSRNLATDGTHRTFAPGIYQFFPTLENSWGQRLLEFIPIVIDRFGVEGIYLDQSDCVPLSCPTYSEDYWDGHSFEINPESGRITRRYGNILLLSDRYKVAFLREALRRGRAVVANGVPFSTGVSDRRLTHLVEIGNEVDAFTVSRAHLTTPIALDTRPISKDEEDALDLGFFRAVLDHGGLTYPYFHIPGFYQTSDFYQQLYPFTPLSLYAGVLIGRERIVTNRSGLFGWDDKSKFTVRFYGNDGNPIDRAWNIVEIDRRVFAQVTVNTGEVAIVVRD